MLDIPFTFGKDINIILSFPTKKNYSATRQIQMPKSPTLLGNLLSPSLDPHPLQSLKTSQPYNL